MNGNADLRAPRLGQSAVAVADELLPAAAAVTAAPARTAGSRNGTKLVASAIGGIFNVSLAVVSCAWAVPATIAIKMVRIAGMRMIRVPFKVSSLVAKP